MRFYNKDTIIDKYNKHMVHIEPSISDLKKIINIEGAQRILLISFLDALFVCAKAYENTHFDIYNTLLDNNYIKFNTNNFGFLIETKQFFGGSIISDKNVNLEYEDKPLYCKNFNLYVIKGNYTDIDQAMFFYNLLPQKIKNIIGDLDIDECTLHLEKYYKLNDTRKDLDTYLCNNTETDILLNQIMNYINTINKLMNEEDVDKKQIKSIIKLITNIYFKFKQTN